jgi:hypothetical protein
MNPIDVYKLVLCGKLKIFPMYFWEQPEALDNAEKIIKYMLEDYLGLDEKDIPKKISQKLFRDNKLHGMLMQVFEGSHFDAIKYVYPNKFKPWEMRSVPKNFWCEETGILATKWLIEEKLQWSDTQVEQKLNRDVFEQYGLLSMLRNVFSTSVSQALRKTYPNKKFNLSNRKK